LDDAQTSLLRCVKKGARRQRLTWQNLSERLARVRPALLLKQRREVSRQVERRLHEQVRQQLETRRSGLGALEGRLRLLGPGAGAGPRLFHHHRRGDRQGLARGTGSESRPTLEDPP
jgi:exonuclease VII large subunit